MAKQLTRSAARIYGALSGLGEGSGNVLERLLPFFDPLLRNINGQILDPAEFARSVREIYKWNFNADLVEAFVPYFLKNGWISADIQNSANTTYTICIGSAENSSVTENSVDGELKEIASKFKKFAEELSPLTEIPRDVEEFEDILVEWLLYIEAFSEKNLDFKVSNRADSSGKLRQIVHVPETTSLRDEEQFLCARFVRHVLGTDSGAAEILTKIASIGLLTEVVQDFVKPVEPIEGTNLVVYLDAPVALEFLGASGKAARDNTAPVISELIRIGASVRIFGQSVEELKNILQAVLRNPRPTGPTAQALIRGEVLREYVANIAEQPLPILAEHGIKVTYRELDVVPSEHVYFTEGDRDELYNALRYAENPAAREHDASIVTFVMRQRHASFDRDLFRSKFIILTRNGLLAQSAQKIAFDLGRLAKGVVPPVIHRRVLATAMWLRTGLGASDLNIPKRMLLASCERVLAIKPGVVEAVRRITEALGDEEKARQLDLLVSQARSAQVLMDKTLGAANVVTEENISILFEEMLHPHLEEERARGRDAVRKAREKGRDEVGEVSKKLQESEEQWRNAETKLNALYEEDKSVVGVLCLDAEKKLSFRRKFRSAISLFLAIIFCIPAVFMHDIFGAAITLFLSIVMAFLTITGKKFIGIETSDEAALKVLKSMASSRRLEGKISQFNIKWQKTKFSIGDHKAELSERREGFLL